MSFLLSKENFDQESKRNPLKSTFFDLSALEIKKNVNPSQTPHSIKFFFFISVIFYEICTCTEDNVMSPLKFI